MTIDPPFGAARCVRGVFFMTRSPNQLSASEAVRRMREGRLKAVDLVKACLERIEKRESQVHAWEALDAERALQRARELDKRPGSAGPLHGIPLAIKDVIDTRAMTTECGSPIYRGRKARRDATCVATLTRAGAIVLGKSVTTEFAGAHAGKTHNPHHLRHTPGGSSSGSAAAVADFMAGVGVGTQTSGSTIRPGAFNGIVAFKGTFGWADLTGVKTYARSLDTLGFFVREARDLTLIRSAYGFGAIEPSKVGPRIGFCRTPWWDLADAYNRRNIGEAVRLLRDSGASVGEWKMPQSWSGLIDAHNRVMTRESTEYFGPERDRYPRLLSPSLTESMAFGDTVTGHQYTLALKHKRQALEELKPAWDRFDCLLVPAARGEAPMGLGHTGDPVFNRYWTFLGAPCIALPFGKGPYGLPLAVQLVGRHGQDDKLIAAARWIEKLLHRARGSWATT
jgi:amidase